MTKRLWLSVAILSLVATSAQGGMGRVFQYGMETADARVPFGGRIFSVYVHPKEDVLLVQTSMKDLMAKDGQTVPISQMVLEQFLQPVGCQIGEVHLIASASFEAPYTCQPGIDLRGLILSQRTALTKGLPLQKDPR